MAPPPLLLLGALGLASLRLAQLLIHAHRDVTDDAVRHANAALDFLHERARSQHGQKHVIAIAVATHLVGQALLAPVLDLLDLAAFLLDEALDGRGQTLDVGLAEIGISDEDDFVRTLFHQSSSWTWLF